MPQVKPVMAIKGNAVLYSEMTPPDGGLRAFNDWYDNHHTPSHVQGVPGFLSAMRYQSAVGPHFLAVYELDSPDALDCDEYRSRKLTPDEPTARMLESVSGFTRYIAAEAALSARGGAAEDALDAAVIFSIFFRVPSERVGEFEDWYDTEHVPVLLECEDWLMARRLQIVEYDPEPYTHLFLHYLNHESALQSDALMAARQSEWRLRLAAEPWFTPTNVTYHRRRNRFSKSG
jgi:hypothetical protein